ncbi:hypothetical protein KR059_001124 [Drosophila kikkawai]|nr:hypothetical protein KR059_001124 [Drosophila kikkawai]
MSSSKKVERRRSPAYPEDDETKQDYVPTPREAMRLGNCQDYRFHRAETYPSIRPQVSRCDPNNVQANAWLADSLEADGCGRSFDVKQDDLLYLWQQIPDKNTLGFYGVGSPRHQPESVTFNQVLKASLDKAGVDANNRRSNRPTPPPPPKATPLSGNTLSNNMCQPFILNRQALQTELQQMPMVQRRLNPLTALESVFCPDPVDPFDPSGIARLEEMKVSIAQALDMKGPPKQKPHGLRRHHWYCPADCDGEQNACAQYEWAKYKLDPRPYNAEFRQWLRDQKEIRSPEPKDYDQLYERFLNCFERNSSPDPLLNTYKLCCAAKSCGDDGKAGGGSGHGGAGGDGASGGGGTGGGGGAGGGASGEGGRGPGREGSNETGYKDKDKDGNKDKNKDKEITKNKDKNTGKDIGKDKDKVTEKGKGTGDRKDLGEYEGDGDGEATGGDGKRKDKKNVKEGKEKSEEQDEKKINKTYPEPDNNPPTKIPQKEKEKARKPPKEIADIQDPPEINQPVINNPDTALVTGTEGSKNDFDNDDLGPVTDWKDKYPSKNKTPGKGKDKEKNKRKGKDKGKEKDKDMYGCEKMCHMCPPAGCPCEICSFMHRIRAEPEARFILDMKREEKRRQLRDYYRQMCHREYIRNSCREDLRTPLHKCDPIDCDNSFCRNPHFSQHCDCLDAVQDLQKLLVGGQDKSWDQKLLQQVEHLRRRISQRMCDCILP